MQALQLVGIRKAFGDGVVAGRVAAVRGASLSCETGHVHAVVGEDGAGKSTLLKIAAGIVQPDAGEVHVEGRLLRPHTAAEAIRRGVGMVQQDLALIGSLTVLENVALGAEPTRWGRLDLDAARQRASQVIGELGPPLPLDEPASSLVASDRQRVAIARVLFRNARVLVFDEPAAVLAPREVEALYATLRRLAASGRAVIVVTRSVDEVVAHADAATVMRRGDVLSSRVLPPRGKRRSDAAELASEVAGGEPLPPLTRAGGAFGGPALVVKEVRVEGALDGVSFEVRSGEIVGLSCADERGARELVRVVAGLDRPDAGMVWLKTDGPDGERAPPALALDGDRDGLVLDADVRDNVLLGDLPRFSIAGVLRSGKIDAEARRRVERALLRPADPRGGGAGGVDMAAPVRTLSPGDRRRVVVSRALARVEAGAPALVLVHPTRGVDLATGRWIHEQIADVALRRRCAVLVVSTDLAEVRAIADRVLVLSRGRVGELPAATAHSEISERMFAIGGTAG